MASLQTIYETDQHGLNILHVQLVSYGEPNFERDVELTSIVTPTTKDEEARYNPVCNYPVVRIRNLGAETLTQADFAYGVDGGFDCYYTWTGSLAFMEEAEVTLPTFDWNGVDVNNPRFHVTVNYPNGGSDQNPYNNAASTAFELVPVYDSVFIMLTRTNAAGNETSYEIRDENDSIVYAKNNFPNSTTVNDTLRFQPGCYKLTVFDSDEDGLSFFLNNDGNGFVRLRNLANTTIFKSFEPDFGEKFSHQFMVGYPIGEFPLKDACTPIERDTTAIGEVSGPQPYVTLHPNPSNGAVILRGLFYQPTDLTVEVYNLQGMMISRQHLAGITQLHQPIDLTTQSPGTYIISVLGGSHRFVHKLIKE